MGGEAQEELEKQNRQLLFITGFWLLFCFQSEPIPPSESQKWSSARQELLHPRVRTAVRPVTHMCGW